MADPAALLVTVPMCRCGRRLVRTSSGWLCATPGHTRLIDHEQIIRRIEVEVDLLAERPPTVSPHQWGWYRTRRREWAARIVRELTKNRRV